MKIVLPPPSTSLSIVLDSIKRGLIPAISQNEATARVLLLSPNGTVYSLTVKNDGTLLTEVTDDSNRT